MSVLYVFNVERIIHFDSEFLAGNLSVLYDGNVRKVSMLGRENRDPRGCACIKSE